MNISQQRHHCQFYAMAPTIWSNGPNTNSLTKGSESDGVTASSNVDKI